MLCLLSPTKTLAEEACARAKGKFGPCSPRACSKTLLSARAKLVERCRALKKSEIKSLMSLSDSLAALNFGRFQKFADQAQYPAAWYFDGPSFVKLGVRSLSTGEHHQLEGSLGILSGLYGVLRPSDLIQAYRLEMGTRLVVEDSKNLYQFWSKHNLADEIIALAAQSGKSIILNCASQEYSKAVDFAKLRKAGLTVVDVGFKTAGGGNMPSVYAKQARGMIVRYVVKRNPQTIADLKAFTGDGHFLFSAGSSDSTVIFERHSQAQGPGDDTSICVKVENKAKPKRELKADAKVTSPKEKDADSNKAKTKSAERVKRERPSKTNATTASAKKRPRRSTRKS